VCRNLNELLITNTELNQVLEFNLGRMSRNLMAGCENNCGVGAGAGSAHERRILIVVLLINAAMFAAEFSAGLVAGSTALLADSLDMLADAIIYAIGLFALGRARHWRARAALTSGLFQLVLGAGIAIEAIVKLIVGGLPDVATMGLFGVLALVANTICFVLLARFRDGDINLRATWICSRNDMIGNVGVLIAAGLVMWLDSGWPDIIIGLFIAVVVIRSALRITLEARSELHDNLAKS
jgi:cation diffusion facilitator family transporter